MKFLPVKDDRGNNEVILNIDDLGIMNANLKPYLQFRVTTYTKLSRTKAKPTEFESADCIWDRTFLPVNDFFTSLSKADQQYIAMFIISSHSDIISFMSKADMTNITTFIQNIGAGLLQLDQTINLCDKLKTYVETSIPIGDFSNVGKRPQDTAGMTFYKHEVIDLLTITVLCKLLAPLYGVLMGCIRCYLDNKLKESHCAAILNLLFRTRYPAVIKKLRFYIENTVKTELNEDETSIFHGNTNFTVSHYIFDSLLSRSFINVNLFSPEGNLMKFIIATVKHAVSTQKTNMRKLPFRIRQPIGSNDGDDSKIAQYEIDSLSSIKTADTVPIVLAAVPQVIKSELEFYQINVDDYIASLNYYHSHVIIPNEFNKLMNCLYFGRKLGGGKSISMLHAPAYTQLTALLQIITFAYGYLELGHMLTAAPALEAKMVQSPSDDMIKLNYGTSFEYKLCQARYVASAFGNNGKEWDQQISKLVDILMKTNFIYNTWDGALNTEDTDNSDLIKSVNGRIILNSENLIVEFCKLTDTILTRDETIANNKVS